MEISEEKIEEAIDTYNKYRSPRATAQLLENSSEDLKVQIEGSFCRSCGMEDYFIDMVYELEEKGIEVEYEGFEEIGKEKFVARYSLS